MADAITELNGILEDSSLKLAVQMDEATASTKDMGASFDIAADTSMDYAHSQEKLTKSLNKENKKSKENAKLNDEYQESIKKRIKMEEELAKQSPIIRYSDQTNGQGQNNDSAPPADGQPTPPPDKKPKDPVQTLEEYLKQQLGSQQEFKDAFIDQANKDREERAKFVKKMVDSVNIIGKMKSSDSVTARLAGSAMSKGVDAIMDMADGILGQIPGYKQVKDVTKFVAKTVSDVSESKRKKKLDKAADKEYSRRVGEETSKFRRREEESDEGSPEPGPAPAPDPIRDEQEDQEREDNERARDEEDRERDENGNRHNSLLKILTGIKDVMLLRSIMGAAAIVTGIGGIMTTVFASLGAALTAGFGGIVAAVGSLAAIVTGKKALDAASDAMGGGPEIDPDDPEKRRKNNINRRKRGLPPLPDVDTPNPRNGPTPDAPDGPDGKPKGLMSKISKAASKFLPKAVTKTAGKALALAALPIPGARIVAAIGTLGLMYDAYTTADEAGLFDDSEAKDKPEVKKPDVSDFKPAPTSQNQQAEEVNTVLTEKEKEAKRKESEMQKQAYAAMANTTNKGGNTIVATGGSNTTVLPGGFGYPGDNYMQMAKYGEQTGR